MRQHTYQQLANRVIRAERTIYFATEQIAPIFSGPACRRSVYPAFRASRGSNWLPSRKMPMPILYVSLLPSINEKQGLLMPRHERKGPSFGECGRSCSRSPLGMNVVAHKIAPVSCTHHRTDQELWSSGNGRR